MMTAQRSSRTEINRSDFPVDEQRRRAPLAQRPWVPVVVPIVVMIVWALLTHFEVVSRVLLPSPVDVGHALYQLVVDGELAHHLIPSLSRVLQGFVIGAGLGIALGFLVGMSDLARRALAATFELLRPIPPIALIPITLLWFGIGGLQAIVLIAFSTFWPVVLNTELGVREIPKLLSRAADVMEIRGWRYYIKIVLPAALPKILVGLRIGSAIALIVMVATEMVAAPQGIGFLIINAQRTFETPTMYAGIIVISALGYIINLIMVHVERLALPYSRLKKTGESR